MKVMQYVEILLDHGIVRSPFGQQVFKITLAHFAKLASLKFISGNFCDNQSFFGLEIQWADELSNARQSPRLMVEEMANFVHDLLLKNIRMIYEKSKKS